MKLKNILIVLVALCIAVLSSGSSVGCEDIPGAVYTMTNSANGNRVLVFDRDDSGDLTAAGSFATGGLGSGAGLGNQSALVLDRGNRWLFAVNAGSNEISVFAIEVDGLSLVDRVPSGGLSPISLAVDGNLLYVLNAGGSVGGSDSITGFTIGPDGTLSPLAGSTRPLSADSTAPAQIGFNLDRSVLVVTEKATSKIDTYVVGADGLTTGPITHDSAGQTPFGFAFGKRDQVFVSEAFGGTPNAAALSSYLVSSDGGLDVISASVGNNQTAACWVVVTNDGRFAYDTNAGSDSVSGFSIDFDGTLTLIPRVARIARTGKGGAPIDMALTNDGRFLYTLNGGNGTIGAFSVTPQGLLLLRRNNGASGLPLSANGLAAR